MYLESLKILYKYLEGLVVSGDDVDLSTVGGDQVADNSLPAGFILHGGLLYRSNGYTTGKLYDQYGVFDPFEGRVEGDHYATSHFVLMAAAMFRLTGEPKYLQSCIFSGEFCLRCLNGYPYILWDMHFDFNNYALALACYLLGDELPVEVRGRWIHALSRAAQNKHRVGNWFGQRLLYYSLFKKLSGSLGAVKSIRKNVDRVMYSRCFASDGAVEDHPGKSRPIQYHAFNLAIILMLGGLERWRNAGTLVGDGLDYLVQFIAPDGDFNYYGRGQKQIFAYSPALFAFETSALSRPELKESAIKVWNFVRRQQRSEGDFQLVLSPVSGDTRVGWYDYHRHSVYNAFFGAWLALAELQRVGKPAVDCSGVVIKSRHDWQSRQVNIFVLETDSYFVCLSQSFRGYSSECGGSPQKFYVKGAGNLFTCPGGPSAIPGGFGNRFIFDHIDINYTLPLWKREEGAYAAPIGGDSVFLRDKKRVRYKITSDEVDFLRTYEFKESFVAIEDVITVKSDLITTLRLVNLPVNTHCFDVDIVEGTIVLSSKDTGRLVCKIEVECDGVLAQGEEYQWVDGMISIVKCEVFPSVVEYSVKYLFSFFNHDE